MPEHQKIRFYPQAKADIAEILDYLRTEASPQIAHEFLATLDTTTVSLLNHPELGVLRSYKSPLLQRVRMIPLGKFSKYLLFYESQGGFIDVIRVVHGARDLEMRFRADLS